MARKGVAKHGISIRLACVVYGISENCYRYQAKLDGENALVADWLLKLTQTHKRWVFGLCFLYLRNVKGYPWNQNRVYRIYRELELNLRSSPDSGSSGITPGSWMFQLRRIRSGRWIL